MDITAFALPIQSRRRAAYGLAAVLTAVEIVVYVRFADQLQAFPFLAPVAAVTVSAFFGGRGPAILSALMSGLYVHRFIMPPRTSFALDWPNGYIGMLFYYSLCAIIIFLMHRMFAAYAALQVSETRLQELNEDLERRVAERTSTLIEAQTALRDANQNLEGIVEARVGELRVANDEIQRFAYIVSHDLRAPLVNVLGFTSELDTARLDLGDLLREVESRAPDLVTPERRDLIETDLPEALGFIRTSTQKMDRLINAILKLSREGRRELTPQPIDLAALVKTQGESLSQQMSARQAELEVAGALPPLVSDRLAVEQIFGNLIENAVKYLASDRAGRISVSGRAEGPNLRYEIADNGRGIAAKDFERIFELFRRSGEQDQPGEGIGLAYVRNLARRLGGNVTVRSEFGVGSTFCVTLPAIFRTPSEGARLDGVM